KSVQAVNRTVPSFASAGSRMARNSFYGTQNTYRNFPSEGTYITCRGPEFTECYDRYLFDLAGVEGATTVVVPRTEAAGKPWIFPADFVRRDATVDLALLAKGFHIVTGPVPYNDDGPKIADWDRVYRHMVANGFSARPVLEGAGGAAGEAYAWAIANPEKVSCVYAENPILRSKLSNPQPLDNLSPLAKADVPIIHVCGSLDPYLNDQTRTAE